MYHVAFSALADLKDVKVSSFRRSNLQNYLTLDLCEMVCSDSTSREFLFCNVISNSVIAGNGSSSGDA